MLSEGRTAQVDRFGIAVGLALSGVFMLAIVGAWVTVRTLVGWLT